MPNGPKIGPRPHDTSYYLGRIADWRVPGADKRLGDVGEDAARLGKLVSSEAGLLYPPELLGRLGAMAIGDEVTPRAFSRLVGDEAGTMQLGRVAEPVAEPRYAYRGMVPGEGEISAPYHQATSSLEEAQQYAKEPGRTLGRIDLSKLPKESYDISGGHPSFLYRFKSPVRFEPF